MRDPANSSFKKASPWKQNRSEKEKKKATQEME